VIKSGPTLADAQLTSVLYKQSASCLLTYKVRQTTL